MRLNAPSLTIGFLVVVAALVVVSGYVLGTVLRDNIARQRLQGAEIAASVFASSLRDSFEVEDGRLTSHASRELDEAVRSTPELSAIRVWDRRYHLLHASMPALTAGTEGKPTEEFAEAAAGGIASEFTSLAAETHAEGEQEVSIGGGDDVEVYLPVRSSGVGQPDLVLEAYLPYAKVRDDITAATHSLYVILGVGALLFYLALLPTLFRASRALAEARERRAPGLQRRLRRAIARDQLELHFQPKLDLETRKVAGVEALVRWRLPRGRLAPPGEFLPHVEETEVMKPLTVHIFTLALQQGARWHHDDLPLNVAVNLSAFNLADEELPAELERLARTHGIPPRQVTLEITETAAMRRLDEVQETLSALAACGFQLSIDDFGTGQSSLARLDQLPFRELKIDRSLVSRMRVEHEPALIRSIISLSHELGLRVVGEGVESDDVLNGLEALGCDVVQGYGIAVPAEPSHIPDLVATLEFTSGPAPRGRTRDSGSRSQI